MKQQWKNHKPCWPPWRRWPCCWRAWCSSGWRRCANVGKGRSEIITDFLRAELIHDGGPPNRCLPTTRIF